MTVMDTRICMSATCGPPPASGWSSNWLRLASKRLPDQNPISVRKLIGFWSGSRFEASLNQLLDHPLAGGGPHVADIQILVSITVIIEPCRAHSRPDIF